MPAKKGKKRASESTGSSRQIESGMGEGKISEDEAFIIASSVGYGANNKERYDRLSPKGKKGVISRAKDTLKYYPDKEPRVAVGNAIGIEEEIQRDEENEKRRKKKERELAKENARLNKAAKAEDIKRRTVEVHTFTGRTTLEISKDLRTHEKDKKELEENKAGLLRDKEALDRAEAALATARKRFEEMHAHGARSGAEFQRIAEEQERAKANLMASLFEASRRIANLEELIQRNDAQFAHQQDMLDIEIGGGERLRDELLRQREMFAAELGEAQRGNINLEQRIIALEANARSQIDRLNAEIEGERAVLSERSPFEFDLARLEIQRSQFGAELERERTRTIEQDALIDELTNTIQLLVAEAEHGILETDPLIIAAKGRERELEMIAMINERAAPQREVQQLQVEATPAVIAGSLVAAGSMMTPSMMEGGAGPAPRETVPFSVFKDASNALRGARDTITSLRSLMPREGEMVVPAGSQILPQGHMAIDPRNVRLTRTDPYITSPLRNYMGPDDPFNNRGIVRNVVTSVVDQIVRTERFSRMNPGKTALLVTTAGAAIDYAMTGEFSARRVGPIVNGLWVLISGYLAPGVPLEHASSSLSFMYNNIPEVKQYVDSVYDRTIGRIGQEPLDPLRVGEVSHPPNDYPMVEGPTAIPPGPTQDTTNAPPPGPRSYGFTEIKGKDHSKSIATPLGPAQTNYRANQVTPKPNDNPDLSGLTIPQHGFSYARDTIKSKVHEQSKAAAAESLIGAVKFAKTIRISQKMSKKFGVLSRSDKLKSIGESLVDYIHTKREASAKRAAELLMALNYEKYQEIAGRELFNAGRVTVPQFSRPVINKSQMF